MNRATQRSRSVMRRCFSGRGAMVKPIGKTFLPLTTIAPFSSIETFEPSCAIATDVTGSRQTNISSADARHFIAITPNQVELATDGAPIHTDEAKNNWQLVLSVPIGANRWLTSFLFLCIGHE